MAGGVSASAASVTEDAPSLPILRAPLEWLIGGGEGVVPIDLEWTAYEVRAAMEAGGKMKFEDDRYAAEIAAAIRSLTNFEQLVVDSTLEAA